MCSVSHTYLILVPFFLLKSFLGKVGRTLGHAGFEDTSGVLGLEMSSHPAEMVAVGKDASFIMSSGKLSFRHRRKLASGGSLVSSKCGDLATGFAFFSLALNGEELAGGQNKEVRTDLVRLSNLF